MQIESRVFAPSTPSRPPSPRSSISLILFLPSSRTHARANVRIHSVSPFSAVPGCASFRSLSSSLDRRRARRVTGSIKKKSDLRRRSTAKGTFPTVRLARENFMRIVVSGGGGGVVWWPPDAPPRPRIYILLRDAMNRNLIRANAKLRGRDCSLGSRTSSRKINSSYHPGLHPFSFVVCNLLENFGVTENCVFISVLFF